jgi:UDP-GlcNAc3NAcA epimerase
MLKIATIVGARPQFIKAAVVSRAIRARGLGEVLIHTGQHYDANMSDIFFEEMQIPRPDHHLGVGGGTHGQNTGRMLEAIEAVLAREAPDWVLVYGDTDSTLAGALAASKLHLPLAHVEAGLRSFNRRMPEEINRILTDHASDLLFPPTTTAVAHLATEGISGDKVKLVGDVMYDAALYYAARARRPSAEVPDAGFVLCTVHRAENTDDPARLAAILAGLNAISAETPVVLPLHPRTAKMIASGEAGALGPNVRVIDPVGFLEMCWLLAHCAFVVTDSGGLQKEAYFHRRPCLILRDQTEWVELLDTGFSRLVAVGRDDLFAAHQGMRERGTGGEFPPLYGDGNSAGRIAESLLA